MKIRRNYTYQVNEDRTVPEDYSMIMPFDSSEESIILYKENPDNTIICKWAPSLLIKKAIPDLE